MLRSFVSSSRLLRSKNAEIVSSFRPKWWNISTAGYCKNEEKREEEEEEENFEESGPGSHLIRHNDPPRSKGPEIFKLDEPPDHSMIDHDRLNVAPGRIKKFPPPRLKIMDLDYSEPPLPIRAVERVQTWALGTYHIFGNLLVLYDIKKERAGAEYTFHDGRVRQTIKEDMLKLAHFVFAVVFFPPAALAMLVWAWYNPYMKLSSFWHPRDMRKYLIKVCPEIGSFNDMLDEFIGIDPDLLSLYEKEFQIDFKNHCLSADDAIRLFPHSKLAVSDIVNMRHDYLIRISHGFPAYRIKSTVRMDGFFNKVCEGIGHALLEDRIRARTPGTREKSPFQLWDICYKRGLFWTKNGVELSNGQLMYLYSQWMKIALIKQRNRKTMELLFFFIIFNVGRDVVVPDAKPSDWAFVEQFFQDFSVQAQQGAQGTL